MYHVFYFNIRIPYLSHTSHISVFLLVILRLLKDTLWVLSRDEPLVHVSIDISLINKDILDHVISLES